MKTSDDDDDEAKAERLYPCRGTHQQRQRFWQKKMFYAILILDHNEMDFFTRSCIVHYCTDTVQKLFITQMIKFIILNEPCLLSRAFVSSWRRSGVVFIILYVLYIIVGIFDILARGSG